MTFRIGVAMFISALKAIHLSWIGPELGPPGSNWCFSFALDLAGYSAPRDLHRQAAYSICESWVLNHQDVYLDLYACSW